MSGAHVDMRTVSFGRNTLFKRHRLQCGSRVEVGFCCRSWKKVSRQRWSFFLSCDSNSESLFFPVRSRHMNSYQSKRGQCFFCVSLVWKIAGGAGGVGVHACMWMIPSALMPPLHPPTVPSAHPGEKLDSVTAAHTRWLSKKGQVVVPSVAQSSVDAAHADICLPQTAAGRGKICFSICLGSSQPFSPPIAPPTLFCTPAPLLLQS